MNNSERMAWKKSPMPWKQNDTGDVIDANGHFIQFDELVNEQLQCIVSALNIVYNGNREMKGLPE